MSRIHEVDTQAAELAQTCLAVRVRLLSRLVSRIYESHLRGSDLTIGQLNMLAATLHLGPDLASASLLGKALHMEKSTVSRNLDKMEDHGWIRRSLPVHGRLEAITVTARGRRTFSKAYQGWTRAQAEASDEIGPKLIDALADAFELRSP